MSLRLARCLAIQISAALILALTVSSSIAEAATPLVSTEWLKSNLGRDDLVILDIRSSPSAITDFVQSHIPRAILSEYPGAWRTDDGLVPPLAEIGSYLSNLGVGEGKTVIIAPEGTDSTEFGAAARIYWTLKYLGHDDVTILDGGWRAWKAKLGDPVVSGEAKPVKATFVAHLHPELLISTAAVEDKLGSNTILFDARPQDQYLGKTKSPAATRFGHIPGAINLENEKFYDAVGHRLKSREQLATLIPASLKKGADIVTYCNTGHWSATDWFVLHELLGYQNVALYVESMAGWTADPSRLVETRPTYAPDLKH